MSFTHKALQLRQVHPILMLLSVSDLRGIIVVKTPLVGSALSTMSWSGLRMVKSTQNNNFDCNHLLFAAHLKHKVNRVVVFDIDLHHGNGTQSIVWNINEEAYRAETEAEACDQDEREASESPEKPDAIKSPQKLKAYYGSIHDVMSFPCEVRV
jgi:hypothetical protein